MPSLTKIHVTIVTALATGVLGLSPASATGIPVVDVAHIAANQTSHTIDYIQQVLHEFNSMTTSTASVIRKKSSILPGSTIC